MHKIFKVALVTFSFIGCLASTPKQSFAANNITSLNTSTANSSDRFQPFTIESIDNDYVYEYAANNLSNTYLSTKTTQLQISSRLISGYYVLRDSDNHQIVLNTGEHQLNPNRPIVVPAGLLKAGKTYYLSDSKTVYDKYIFLEFQVVAGKPDIATPKVNPVTDSDKQITGTASSNTALSLTIGSDSYQTTVDGQGNFKIDLNKTYPAGSKIDAYVTDKDGNQSDHYQGTVQKSDALPKPILDTITDSDTLITGTGTPGATIYTIVNNNGQDITFHSTVKASGLFAVNMEGTYPAGTTVQAYQELNGLFSPLTSTFIEHDDQLTVNEVTTNSLSVTGTATPYSNIHVIEHSKQLKDRDFYGTADKYGNYSVSLQGAKFKAGTQLTVIAEQPDTHKTEQKDVQVYPAKLVDPTINSVVAGQSDISGTAEPNADVFITLSNTTYQTKSKQDGTYTQNVDPTLVKGNAIIQVYSVSNGAKSNTVSAIIAPKF